jgi:hypothetical protein
MDSPRRAAFPGCRFAGLSSPALEFGQFSGTPSAGKSNAQGYKESPCQSAAPNGLPPSLCVLRSLRFNWLFRLISPLDSSPPISGVFQPRSLGSARAEFVTAGFCAWITEPGMILFHDVRLIMNSLRRRGVDIIRRLINEPAPASQLASALDSQWVATVGPENPLSDQPSQNYSWATSVRVRKI